MNAISQETLEKYAKLQGLLKEMEKVLVAFSGGVDSTFLLRVAKDVLGKNILAVIASSETYPIKEKEAAIKLAKEIDVSYRVIQTEELENPEFAKNPPKRCYFCKIELFSKLKEIASEEGIYYVLDGSNFEDQSDFRPGLQAAQELGIRSPLKESGLIKDEIRELSKKLGLSTWDKPSMACLSSRFPYYTLINKEDLVQIDQAEEFLRGLGISQLRVRHHGQIARIEVESEEIPKLMDAGTRDKIVQEFKRLGYTYVTIDLSGYRTGSMNEPILNSSD